MLLFIRILNAIAGLKFEHQRKDRDYYVEILWDNIKDGYEILFQKDHNYPPNEEAFHPFIYPTTNNGTSYLFSKNGQPTIVPLRHLKMITPGTYEDYMRRVDAIYSKLIYRSYLQGILYVHKGPLQCGPKNVKLDYNLCPNFASTYRQ